MDRKRVFKTKTFDRWARKVVGDVLLCSAAREIEAGLYEAGLGHGSCKKRIATNQAKMSQAVFASFLNVSVSTVRKWESPTSGERSSGDAAKLLQLAETKGIEVLLA